MVETKIIKSSTGEKYVAVFIDGKEILPAQDKKS